MPRQIRGTFKYAGLRLAIARWHKQGTPSDIDGEEHYHTNFSELCIVDGGRGTALINGVPYPVMPGDVYLVQGQQTHAYRDCQNLRYVHIAYDPAGIALPTQFLSRMPGYQALFVLEPGRRSRESFPARLRLSPTDLSEAMRHVSRIEDEMGTRQQGYEAAALAGLVALMVFLSRCYSRESVGEGQALLRIGEVLGLIEGRYDEPWRLDDLCAVAQMGKSKLTEAFRTATGHSPIDYLIHLRLRQAMKLLRETDRTVTDIAYSTGFSDSNYLSRKFRDVLNTTPTAYRDANRLPMTR